MIESPQNMIDALRAGDEDGYRQLYDLYYEPVYVLAYGILQNDADAQDAVQRTFIQVFRKLSALKNDAGFVKWLLKIANNEALMILRSRRPAELFDEESDPAIELRQNELTLPEAALERRDTAEQLRQMIARLPVEQRRALVLHYYCGLKVAEIAQIMECSPGTVKSRLRYARLRIKKEWEEHESEDRKKLNGVMLPFGEVLIRLLRKGAKNKRRKAAVWKRIKAFLRHRDEPGYAAAAKAENVHAFRVAAGVAAGFVAVMLSSATLVGIAADGEEVGSAYGFGEQIESEKVKEPNERETVYIPPQDIAEQRIADMPAGDADSAVYYYEMMDVPAVTDEGRNDPSEYGLSDVTEPSTEPSTEPPTQPATQPATQPPTQLPTQPATQPATQPPTEPSASERMSAAISGRYSARQTNFHDIEFRDGMLYADDPIDDQPLDPIRFVSVEYLQNGIYRFQLKGDNPYDWQYGYYYPAGTPLSEFPSDCAHQMHSESYRAYDIIYSDGAYRVQKDALVFVDISEYGTGYSHYRRAE